MNSSIADDRLMQQVRDLTDCLTKVQALTPHRIYNVRTAREDVALSAQASQAVVPELIAAAPDGYLDLGYERLSVFLIGAVQELAARVTALENPPA
jgi:hypothetical protein